jgi:hypothetical protein
MRHPSKRSSQVEEARMPRLVLALPHGEAGILALHQEGGDPFVALVRVGVGEDHEEAGLRGVRDPELVPLQHDTVVPDLRPQLEREGVDPEEASESA